MLVVISKCKNEQKIVNDKVLNKCNFSTSCTTIINTVKNAF